MLLPAYAPQIQYQFLTRELDRVLDALHVGGAISAEVFNDAKTNENFYYWTVINNGRGPVRPKNKKVLHWKDPITGKDVFARYARGVPPRHMRENAIATVQGAVIPGDYSELSRETIQRFVRAVAKMALLEMAERTPVRFGQLKAGYRLSD